jgi:hypothetical protein
MQILEMMTGGKTPQQLNLDTKVDLDALEGILTDEMHNRGISEKIMKIIAVIQNIDGKKIWNLNCVLTGMGILKSHVDDTSETVLKIEKQSLFDIIKHLPMDKTMAPQTELKPQEDISQQIKDLDKLQEEINAEKEKLKSGKKETVVSKKK